MTTSLFPFTSLFPALQNNGSIAASAKLAFYLTGTTTLATVYDDDGNPISQAPNINGVKGVEADAFARFPNIYCDDATTYRVRLCTKLGVQIGSDIDPYQSDYGKMAAQLATASGAGRVGFSQTAAYAQGTDGLHSQALLSIKDAPFNAVGDRTTDNATGIQAALDYGVSSNDQYPAAVFIPAGNFRILQTLHIDQQATIEGEGTSSIINCQGKSFPDPLFANKNVYGLINGQFRNMGGYGGSHFLKLTAATENAEIQLINVVALLQTTAAIESNQLFQTAKIDRCVFGSAPYGMKLNSSGANGIMISKTEFTQHSECSFYCRGAQALKFEGGKFEGGGVTGKNTIDIENADTVTFDNVYFEDTGEFLLRCRTIRGAIVFQNCHFSGTSAGTAPIAPNGYRPYQWDCADQRVTFRDCYADAPMNAPANAMFEGDNVGIYPSKALYWGNDFQGGVKARSIPVPTDLTVDLLTFTRPVSGSLANAQAMAGILTLTYAGIGPDPTGLSRTLMRQYQVLVSGLQVFTMEGSLLQLGTDLGNMNTATVAVAVTGATSTNITLTATFAGIDATTEQTMDFGWSFEWDRAEGPPAVAMTVTIP